ncbi:hypothetical protein AURDEDRAFT_159007 [Auricularia subglabra TFB-10046 SS5]|nr:hypothetical protein AURDEDRAFT_159007 [Auricularia subglabra TFB-10046 SS5]
MPLVSKPSETPSAGFGAVWDFGDLSPSKTIFRCPVEILSRISTFVAWDGNVGAQALRVLCSINRHWRKVVLSTPGGWAKIRIYNDASHKLVRGPRKVLCSITDVKEWFERSKRGALDIALKFDIDGPEDAVFFEFVLDHIHDNSPQVHKLSLRIFHGQDVILPLGRLANSQWMWLRALHLDHMSARDEADILPLLTSASTRAPRLRYLYLDHWRDTLFTPPLRGQLSRLRLDQCSTGDMIAKLGLCSALRTLRIDGLQQAGPLLPVNGLSLTLPLLEALELNLETPTYYGNPFPAGLLRVPALRRLAVRVVGVTWYDSRGENLGAALPHDCAPILQQLLDHSNPPLEELELYNTMMSVYDFRRLALRMLDLKKLVWRYEQRAQDINDLISALSTPTTTSGGRQAWLLPQLADLYLSLANDENNATSVDDCQRRAQIILHGFATGHGLHAVHHKELPAETEVTGSSTAAGLGDCESARVAVPQMVRWRSGNSATEPSALKAREWLPEPVDAADRLGLAGLFNWDDM